MKAFFRLAESQSRDQQLRLIRELMELTATREPASVTEQYGRVAELEKMEKDRDTLLRLLRERNVPATTNAPSAEPANHLDELFDRLARMPVRDPRSPDEIMGYDSHGLPQ